MIDVCLLGTGGMMPMPGRGLSSLLVRHKGKMLLLDCGEGTQVQIKQTGWGLKHIEAICITHYHGDHVAGLPGLLMTLGNSGRTEPLIICGPPELEKVVSGLLVIAPELPFELILEELPEDHAMDKKFGGFLLYSTPVDHNLSCLAYCLEIKRAGKFDPEKARNLNIPVQFWNRLQRGEEIAWEGNVLTPNMVMSSPRRGLKICYCTDTRPVETLVGFAQDADLLVCEGMYGEDEKLAKAMENKHMIFSEAAQLAKQSMVRELWLTHYSPSLTVPEMYISSAQSIFPNTVLGEDLLQKTLYFDKA